MRLPLAAALLISLAACTAGRSPEAPSPSGPSGPAQVGPPQVGPSQVGPPQVGPPQAGPAPGAPTGPPIGTPGPNPQPGLLQIVQVDVIIMESFPPQIVAKIEGTLPDGCSEVGDATQQRTDKTIEITIPIRRTTAGACIAIAPQVSRSIRLNGSFAESGMYTLRVNGIEKTFSL